MAATIVPPALPTTLSLSMDGGRRLSAFPNECVGVVRRFTRDATRRLSIGCHGGNNYPAADCSKTSILSGYLPAHS